MRVSQDDILYYEFFDDDPEYMRPGIIVRGPSSQREIGSSEAPVISNGHTLTLSEARETAGFELQARARLHPGYSLDQIRRIEGRDALQLLYTDGINSVSLFEQPLDGQRGLEPKDFREYAVYRNTEQAGGTILAWKDDARSLEEISLYKDVRSLDGDQHNHAFQKDNDNELELLFSGLFFFYKEFVSSQDGSSCTFTPSCSSYAKQAIKKQGVVIGLINFFDRFSRCNGLSRNDYPHIPNSRLIYDPV